MSVYEYYCEECQLLYTEERPIGTDHPNCPSCNVEYGEVFHVNYEALNVTLGKGIIPVTTMGQQSDINKKRLGKELLQKEEEENRKYDISYQEKRAAEETEKILKKGISFG